MPERNRPPPKKPATDPLDDSQLLLPLQARAVRTENRYAGIRFRHATWERDRRHVLDALEAHGVSDHRYWSFKACGEGMVVMRHADDPTRFKVNCIRCHDRFCLPCSQDRARLIVANLRKQLPEAPTRFLTLTLRHTDTPLADQLNRLYDAFARLRRMAFWQRAVTGGVAFLEIKLSKADLLWHPHLHVILRGSYLPQKLVSDAWLQVTGDSHIVDIRFARDPGQVYSYLARYVTKGWSPAIYHDLDRLMMVMSALHGRKLLIAFGECASLKLLAPPDAETWLELGTLHEVQVLAGRGVPWALQALAVISDRSHVPLLEQPPPDT